MFTDFLNLFQNKTIRRIQQKSPRGEPTVSDRREIIRGFSFKFFTYPKTYIPFCCYFCWLFFFPAVLLLQTLKGNDQAQRDKLAANILLHSLLNFYCYPGCLFHSAKYCWILYIKLVVLCYDTWFSITLSLSALEKKRKENSRSVAVKKRPCLTSRLQAERSLDALSETQTIFSFLSIAAVFFVYFLGL